jgi:HK97 family phage major capsid protein
MGKYMTPEETQEVSEIAAKAASEATEAKKAEIIAEAKKEWDKGIVNRFTPGADSPDSPTNGFKNVGEQLQAVMRVQTEGMRDPRLKAIVGNSEGVPADGGFLVQTDFATTLLEKTFAPDKIVGMVDKIQIGPNSNSMKFPAVSDANRADGSRSGGIRAYWMNEGGSKTESNPHFEQISLELKKLIGYCTVTDELLQDASALEGWIMGAFAKEFQFKLADAIINGDGAGKPLGILNSPCLVTVTAETGQGTSTIVAENIIKMWASRVGGDEADYVWLINQNIEPQLYTMGLAVGAGGIAVYMPAGGLSGASYGTLFGKPVIPCEQCASLGTVGDIILANFKEYQMIEKGGMQSASSIHVNFQTDQSAFRFVYRCDGLPKYRTYITPYKGTTSYQSPFVALSSTRT